MSRAHRLPRTLLLSLMALATALCPMPAKARGENAAILSQRDIFHPVWGETGMVATQDAHATRVGLEVLKQGGNAIDAAVAVGYALAVSLPRAGNLGGGGFMLIHLAKSGETVAIDYRETAPRAAFETMYLDDDGNVDIERARFSHASVAVPGTVAGLEEARRRYGTRPLAELVAPAIRLAREGILVSPDLSRSLAELKDRFASWPASMRIFFKTDGSVWQPGERLLQEDLADSLGAIAEQGPDAFYHGVIAEKIVRDMEAHGGLVTRADLADYRTSDRQPVRGTYRGYDIVSMPPPSSGGIHLIQILNLLEPFDLGKLGHNSAATIHLMAEAMKLAYADRSKYLGDPDFFDVPVAGLISKAYADTLRSAIDPAHARPSADILPGDPPAYESGETTHFSVIDHAGNVVSNTYTLNFSYGTGIVAAGTGILLNNEMDDFSAKPGAANAYGLIGGEANKIESGKRPLSSMTPTLVLEDGKPFLVTGSPGGSRIISTTLQILLNVIDHGMNVAAATAAPRIHHQWLPDELRIEVGLSPDTLGLLKARGHHVVLKDAMGSTQTLQRTAHGLFGASDTRRPDALTLGY